MERLIEFNSSFWNDKEIYIKYKKSLLVVEIDDLDPTQKNQLEKHDPYHFNISGSARVKGRSIVPSTIFFNFNQNGIPIKLKDYEYQETSYITYHYYDIYDDTLNIIKIQRNGFFVYTAPTGQGKTYFALSNLETLSSQFDTMLYINFELSIDDIKNRCDNMNITIPDNLYIAPMESIENIKKWSEDKGKCLFIVDNIDNLVGGGDNAYSVQLDYIKDLDRFLKDYNHHGLVLTQIVKEGSKSDFFDKAGDIHGGINTNILSGVKQLAYLSRSVMMSAYSEEKNAYVYKFLKVGSAKK